MYVTPGYLRVGLMTLMSLNPPPRSVNTTVCGRCGAAPPFCDEPGYIRRHHFRPSPPCFLLLFLMVPAGVGLCEYVSFRWTVRFGVGSSSFSEKLF